MSLCLEAASLLSQVKAVKRHHGDSMTADIQLIIHQMEFMAENIAGEAGVLAATTGFANRVPDDLLPYPVLMAAFLAEYELENDQVWGTVRSLHMLWPRPTA